MTNGSVAPELDVIAEALGKANLNLQPGVYTVAFGPNGWQLADTVAAEEEASPATRKLLNERGREYGSAWRLTTEVHRTIKKGQPGGDELISALGYLYAWMMILSKLIRAMRSPTHKDHWQDIIGFAQLVLDDLEQLVPATTEVNRG